MIVTHFSWSRKAAHINRNDPHHQRTVPYSIRVKQSSDIERKGSINKGLGGEGMEPLWSQTEIHAVNFNRKWASKYAVCNPDRIGRILNSDYSGRSLRVSAFMRPLGVRQVSVLSDLKVGEKGVVVALDLPESVQNHLMHMGFVPDAAVTALRRAPAGDPTVYGVDGLEIALRHETAEAIRIRSAGADLGLSREARELLGAAR
jgi:ferrous iron transport protein A